MLSSNSERCNGPSCCAGVIGLPGFRGYFHRGGGVAGMEREALQGLLFRGRGGIEAINMEGQLPQNPWTQHGQPQLHSRSQWVCRHGWFHFSMLLWYFLHAMQLQNSCAIISSDVVSEYNSLLLGISAFSSQTQEEFSLLYLAQTRDAGEFPRSANVHKKAWLTSLLGETRDETQVMDYPSSLDYRQKGHVTSVS